MAPEVNPNIRYVSILQGESITGDTPSGTRTLKGPLSVRYWEYPDLYYVVLQPFSGEVLRIPREVFNSWPKIER